MWFLNLSWGDLLQVPSSSFGKAPSVADVVAVGITLSAVGACFAMVIL